MNEQAGGDDDLYFPGQQLDIDPDKPAIIMAQSGRVISFGEMEALANQCAHLFRAQGLKRGDGIAFYAENHPLYLPLCWGALRAGLYYTCIARHLKADEVAYIVADSAARLFITTEAKADVAAELTAQMPGVESRWMIGGTIAGYEDFEAAIAAQPTTPIADQSEGGDMLYSSGTTGRPKGIKLPLERETYGAPSPLLPLMQNVYRVNENTVYLSPAPLYHAAPLRFCMSVLRLRGTVIVMEHFDPELALKAIESHRATHSQWVPTMFVRMLKLPEAVRAGYDVSSMKVAIHAAAPCPVQVKKDMIAWWGPVLAEYYAGTEGNGMTMIGSAEWLERPGSVGKAVIGTLRIVGTDGELQPAGQEGTIYFADGRDFVYHNDPERTAESRNDRGWSTLGDVGYVDEEGYLFLTDRKANMIISGGVNIYPQECENLLVTHPKVLDCAVIGVPNEEFGEEVKAVVQAAPGAAPGPDLEAELIAFCREHLSAVKCPRSVDFEAELPREANGKLYKRKLRDRYWEGHGSRLV